jgi:hypothetical protein
MPAWASPERLLPHVSGVTLESARIVDRRLCIWACRRADIAACPLRDALRGGCPTSEITG